MMINGKLLRSTNTAKKMTGMQYYLKFLKSFIISLLLQDHIILMKLQFKCKECKIIISFLA